MKRCTGLLLLLTAAASGCVERRFVVTSDPPGALVYRNGQAIGTTPVDDSFVYYGNYHFTLVKEGYETLQVDEKVRAPWYEYPPLDFFSENIWPFKIRDIQRPHYQMQPLQNVRHDDVLRQGSALRSRGQALTPFNPDSVPPPRGQAVVPVVTPGAPAPGTATPATLAPPSVTPVNPASPSPGPSPAPLAFPSSPAPASR